MNQLLLGASFPFVIGALVYFMRGLRTTFRMLVVVPVCMILCMTWAVAPDIPRVFGYVDLYNRLAAEPRCDIFFWHYTIDRIETDSPWFAVGFVLVIVCVFFAAWRELRIAEEGCRNSECRIQNVE